MTTKRQNPRPEDATVYDPIFRAAEEKYSLPPGLLKAIAYVESRYQPDADAGPRGGKGLMQFVRSTAREYGIDPFNPVESITGAARYMSNALSAFNGDIGKAIQAYNMGIAGAKRFFGNATDVAGDPKYAEKVMRSLERIAASGFVKTNRKLLDGEANIIMNAPPAPDSAPVPGAPSPAAFSPTTPGWKDDIGEMAMLAEVEQAFDATNAEQEQKLSATLRELEANLM